VIVPVPYRRGTVELECAWLHPERRAAPLLEDAFRQVWDNPDDADYDRL